jgi:hypothetical protein
MLAGRSGRAVTSLRFACLRKQQEATGPSADSVKTVTLLWRLAGMLQIISRLEFRSRSISELPIRCHRILIHACDTNSATVNLAC